ncbi:MAG: HIT domain-containing protein [Patescibacteria group bacterium]|jgi:histidine triad (HIT) family protein
MDCVFCKIVAGEIPSYKIYEDDKVLAFLDINPVTSGHTLLIPKEHFKMMVDTPDEMISYLFIRAKELMKTIKKAMNADYVVVSVVGIDVPHFHIHLIPRNFNDGLDNFWPTKKYEEGEVEEIRKQLTIDN